MTERFQLSPPIMRRTHAAEKRLPFPQCPSGLPAVENSLSLMLTEVDRGRITIEQLVHAMCEAPAMVWNIRGKGRIERGFDADVVLVDLNQRRRFSQIPNNKPNAAGVPWHGVEVTGVPVRTWVRGETVFRRENGVDWLADIPCGEEAQFDLRLGGYWVAAEIVKSQVVVRKLGIRIDVVRLSEMGAGRDAIGVGCELDIDRLRPPATRESGGLVPPARQDLCGEKDASRCEKISAALQTPPGALCVGLPTPHRIV